jgi:transposase
LCSGDRNRYTSMILTSSGKPSEWLLKTASEFVRSSGVSGIFGVQEGRVQVHRDHQDAAFSGRTAQEPQETELKRLRKENERLQRERDILKKAVAIFSTDPYRYSGS